MSDTLQYRRLLWFRRLLCLALGLLSIQLVNLQVLRHDELLAKARKNTRQTTIRLPMRGQIRDMRGNVLATSLGGKVVCADPTLLANHAVEVARALAPVLHTNEAYLLAKFKPQIRSVDKRLVTNSYAVLARRVSMEVWRDVTNTMANLEDLKPHQKMPPAQTNFLAAIRRRGIYSQEDQIRVYPRPTLGAHVVGYVDHEDIQAGVAGIEASYNKALTGVAGWRQTEIDFSHREMVPFRDQEVEAQDGLNVVLTIDSGLQYIVESELEDAMREHSPISVSCTVVRPATGEILAMSTLPSYDPNTPGLFPAEFLRNRNITDLAEPGSTFKIVVISAALNEHVARLSDSYDCGNGTFYFARRTLHDAHRHGTLTVEGIIAKSSNIGAAKVALKLGPERMYQYILGYGFGEPTGIPIPGEAQSILHKLTAEDRNKVAMVQIPMGQGIAVTPLQMVMAMSAMANQGRLMRPMLVNRLERNDGVVVARLQPEVIRQVVSPEAAREMVQALKSVVGPEGTAARMGLENYTTAGKTGTAQKVNRKGEGRGYSHDRYFSSFIGFFPADKPELCISVVLDEPKDGHMGSQVAAPVFKRIAQRAASYLNIPPDLQPAPRIRGTLAATGTGTGVGEAINPDPANREE